MTRLHPRPAIVSAHDSHIGGPLLWRADEPWPTCQHPHTVKERVPIPVGLIERLQAAEKLRAQTNVMAPQETPLDKEIAELVGPGYAGFGRRGDEPYHGERYVPRLHERPKPLVALCQLRAADIPDLPRPGGADLLQVLWCPYDHDQQRLWGPTVRLFWRREAQVSDVLAEAPRGEVGKDGYLPRPCRLHPEQVIEYPCFDELPRSLCEQVDAWRAGDLSYLETSWRRVEGGRVSEVVRHRTSPDTVPALHGSDEPAARHRLVGVRRQLLRTVAPDRGTRHRLGPSRPRYDARAHRCQLRPRGLAAGLRLPQLSRHSAPARHADGVGGQSTGLSLLRHTATSSTPSHSSWLLSGRIGAGSLRSWSTSAQVALTPDATARQIVVERRSQYGGSR
jgi:hypothetical protein